jgi:hypothetical protein
MEDIGVHSCICEQAMQEHDLILPEQSLVLDEGLRENKVSHLPSRTSNETARREPRRYVGQPADPMATGATNLVALNNTAAISSATLSDEEAVHDINSPPWIVPPPLRPA